MFYKTPVLRTLLDLRKMCVNERKLNMRYSIYTFTIRFKKHMFYACCTFSLNQDLKTHFGMKNLRSFNLKVLKTIKKLHH